MPKLKERIWRLVKLNSTPEGIALGVAVGVFIAITPFYGLHTLMVVLAILLIPRTNKVAILVGTSISIPPTTPLITWAGYSIGRAILGEQYPALGLSMLKDFTYRDIPRLFYPLLLGSIILGIICAIIFYFTVLFLIKNIRNRRRR
jgi:uncharacterized protein (TIGR03546 family)